MNFEIQSKEKQSKHQFKLEYLYYKSYQNDGHKSGAYTFRPDKSDSVGLPYHQFNRGKIYQGKLVTIVELFRIDEFSNNNILSSLKFFTGYE